MPDLGGVRAVGANESVRMAVPHVKQTTPVWCWAACCEMVSRFYSEGASPRPVKTQAEFAAQFASKFQADLVSMATPMEASWCLRTLAGRDTATWRLTMDDGPPTWDQVCSALSRNQLIITSSRNHALVVCGFKTTMSGAKGLWAHDPAKDTGPDLVSWDALVRDLVGMVWVKQTDAACLD